ncbi:MAG TPA: hypothetical protein VGK72_09945 [Chthoniobacterales bacterium]
MSEKSPSPARSLGSGLVAAALACAIIAAALLSAAPSWHEHLHPDTATTHLCLVTFFVSGHCATVTTAPPAIVPEQPVLLVTLTLPELPALPRTDFFARLEHAPPSLA